MEEVVCAERSGFPFGPGAWPEFWTLLFWSLARPLAVRGVRESEVHRRFGASDSLSRPAPRVLDLVSPLTSRTKLARGVWSVRARRSVCARLCAAPALALATKDSRLGTQVPCAARCRFCNNLLSQI